MDALQVGQALVTAFNKGTEAEAAFVDQYYADGIVSLEGGEDTEEMQARLEGKAAVKGKHSWWYDTNEVHSSEAVGPYIGHRSDQFVVRFAIDLTPKKGGDRQQLEEVGLYTVAGGQIVQEEFLYRMDAP